MPVTPPPGVDGILHAIEQDPASERAHVTGLDGKPTTVREEIAKWRDAAPAPPEPPVQTAMVRLLVLRAGDEYRVAHVPHEGLERYRWGVEALSGLLGRLRAEHVPDGTDVPALAAAEAVVMELASIPADNVERAVPETVWAAAFPTSRDEINRGLSRIGCQL